MREKNHQTLIYLSHSFIYNSASFESGFLTNPGIMSNEFESARFNLSDFRVSHNSSLFF